MGAISHVGVWRAWLKCSIPAAMTLTESSTDEAICRRRGAIGHITLNRPQALNALTLNMVRAISAALDAWERDPAIKAVVVATLGD